MNPSEQRPQMLTPAEVTARCGLSTKTVLRAIRRGDLRASQLGSRRAFRVCVEDLDAWIVATTVLPPMSSSFALPTDGSDGGRLVVRKEMGRRGHRAPDATA